MKKEIVQQDLATVKALLETVLQQAQYQHIERMGGLTNHTYQVTLLDGSLYVVRIPGEGTEQMIVRQDEKKSTELACRLGIDAKLYHFGADGTKVSECIAGATTMSPQTMRERVHIQKAAEIFRRLHQSGVDTGVRFEVFDMAQEYEQIIAQQSVPMFADYAEIKQQVAEVKQQTDRRHGISRVPCHNDPLCENWVTDRGGKMYLIDWEYAGMNDGIWDLADLSIEAEYDADLDAFLLSEYLGRQPSPDDWQHFFANKIYVDYLWTLWAKTRVPYDGQPMEDWAAERYARLKQNLKIYQAKEEV